MLRHELAAVSSAVERDRLGALAVRFPGVHGDRLLLSAKETIYKSWFPLTQKVGGSSPRRLLLIAVLGRRGTRMPQESTQL
jgi:4'-phosphopantetheinyl transferase EntD